MAESLAHLTGLPDGTWFCWEVDYRFSWSLRFVHSGMVVLLWAGIQFRTNMFYYLCPICSHQ